MAELSRARYAAFYGPTAGDQVRLGDTDLWIEVEQDLTAGGEEAVFGGGKSIRESMAQGTASRHPWRGDGRRDVLSGGLRGDGPTRRRGSVVPAPSRTRHARW